MILSCANNHWLSVVLDCNVSVFKLSKRVGDIVAPSDRGPLPGPCRGLRRTIQNMCTSTIVSKRCTITLSTQTEAQGLKTFEKENLGTQITDESRCKVPWSFAGASRNVARTNGSSIRSGLSRRTSGPSRRLFGPLSLTLTTASSPSLKRFPLLPIPSQYTE